VTVLGLLLIINKRAAKKKL